MNVVLHESSEKNLQSIASQLPHALLLTGKKGVGLHAIAVWLAGKDLAATLQPVDSKGATNEQSGTIGVEKIRQLYDQTKGKKTQKQIIIIDNAERMSLGAQAAFLKLLEEPGAHTHFILTSHQPQLLLPTIRSRVEYSTILPVSLAQTAAVIKSLQVSDQTKQAQLQFIAAGLPAELTRLAKDETYFKTRATTMAHARDFLQNNPYQKLLLIQQYKASRDDAITLTESALHILRRSLSAKPQQSIVNQIELLLSIRNNIANNYNISLQLARFVL